MTPRFFRAPHGYRNPWVGIATATLGYHTVAWNVGVWDTACPGAEVIRERVRRALRPGAIVLLHDGDGGNPRGNRMQTASALPHIIRDARQAEYEFRPLAELLLSKRPVHPWACADRRHPGGARRSLAGALPLA